LKAPGTNRLKLKYNEPLTSFAFKFNLRRYNSPLFYAKHFGHAAVVRALVAAGGR